MDVLAEKRTRAIKGIGVSPGIVIGKAYLFGRFDTQAPLYHLSGRAIIAQEVRRFKAALRETEKQLQELKHKLRDLEGREPLYIIDVHIMILKDRSFIATTVENIRKQAVNAEWALRITIDKYKEIFDKMDEEYLRGRISDIQFVGQGIMRNLAGKKMATAPEIGEAVILVAKELSPADTAQIKIDKFLGFATDFGGKTSHTAIVAQSMGIPAVVGLEKITRDVRTNDDIIVDGSSGMVIVNPDPEILKRYESKRKHFADAQKLYIGDASLPAITQDNYRIGIGGNIEFTEEIPNALEHGAENVGLYRTEFIYINREQLPTEEEHFSHYRSIVGVPGFSWVTIRTFDLGGEKFFSDPKLGREMNPQMGLRAIRFCLREKELFKVQLRAIARASYYGKTRLLFPMISGLEEIRQAKFFFREVQDQLVKEGIPIGKDVEIGVMIEVPAAVVVAEALAKEVDFFSIGTNDLIQYALAIDRVNERVTYLYEPLHPAVLRLIARVVRIGHEVGIKVAMCGEMAGEPTYAMVLLGLELDELSMTPSAIPRIKKIIRGSSLEESKQLLEKVMTFSLSAEIRDYVENYMRQKFPDEFLNNGNGV
ncbi:MAG: phosphoenolpyruvate--protein phosphotransferase [Syntrophales bacterium]